MTDSFPDDATLTDLLLEVRRTAGLTLSDEPSDLRIERLLFDSDFDIAATAGKVCTYNDLARSYASKTISKKAEEAINSSRFRYLGLNKDQIPVVAVDWMWGEFTNGFELDTLVDAWVAFLQRAAAMAKKVVGEDSELIQVNLGGPPPLDFLAKLMAFGPVAFPEKVGAVLVYPMQSSSARGEMTRTFGNRSFSKGLKIEFIMVATAAELVELTNLEKIPDAVLRNTGPSAEGKKVVEEQRRELYRGTPLEKLGSEDNAEVFVKNTFLDVASVDGPSNASASAESRSNRTRSIGFENDFDSLDGRRTGDRDGGQSQSSFSGTNKIADRQASDCSSTASAEIPVPIGTPLQSVGVPPGLPAQLSANAPGLDALAEHANEDGGKARRPSWGPRRPPQRKTGAQRRKNKAVLAETQAAEMTAVQAP